MKRSSLRIAALVAALVLGVFPAAGVASAAGPAGNDLLAARIATARFHSLSLAGSTGYGQPPAPAPLHECISSFDGTGAMGVHWLNPAYLTTDLSPSKPQVLVYEPDAHGRLKLVALEFVVFKADWVAAHGDTTPSLFGEDFMDSGFPNRYDLPQFYALHVWLWKSNPAGLFKPFNPNVSCGGTSGSVSQGLAVRNVTADASTASARAGFTCSMRRAASA